MEFLIAAMLFTVSIVALLGAYVSQSALNEHARDLSWAMTDANRVMEEIRLRNSNPCVGVGAVPVATSPLGGVNPGPGWDDWLRGAGGGKSLEQAAAPARSQEYVVVSGIEGTDPMQITVAVCWREHARIVGECAWNGAVLSPSQGSNGFPNDGIIQSQVMLMTRMTCRS